MCITDHITNKELESLWNWFAQGPIISKWQSGSEATLLNTVIQEIQTHISTQKLVYEYSQ